MVFSCLLFLLALRLLRAFAGGVIIALALVHIIPDVSVMRRTTDSSCSSSTAATDVLRTGSAVAGTAALVVSMLALPLHQHAREWVLSWGSRSSYTLHKYSASSSDLTTAAAAAANHTAAATQAVGELNSLMTFPVGGCTILFGIIVLVLIDNSLAAFLAPEHYKQHIQEEIAAKEDPALKPHKHDHGAHAHSAAAAADGHKHGHQHEVAIGSSAAAAAAAAAHTHQCLRSMNASNWVASGSKPTRSIRQYVTAYTMELGCIFHSIIIGIGVGVITEDRHLVITLMIALAIHQGLEALALGSVLALTSFSKLKKVSMLLLYAITTPIGIAVGIAIASSYNPETVTSRAVQGTLNGVSGGMLLYIGMYQLIAEEFSREDILVKPRLRAGMYLALMLGAASMCVLGLWA